MVPTLILDIGLMTILVVVAFAIVRLRSLFAIVMLQGVYSLVCAAWFVSLDAVDVAFTEAAVGAGVSTVLMLAAMLLVDRKSKSVPVSKQIAPLLIVIVAGLAMFYAIPDMPAYGDANSPANSYVGANYMESAGPDTHIPNVVTVVLASYRGYDTFGEVVVIFAAGLGVLLLLGLNGNAGGWKAQPNGQRISAPSAPFAHRDRPNPSQQSAVKPTAVRREVTPESFTAPQPQPAAAPPTPAVLEPALPVKKTAPKKTAPKTVAKTKTKTAPAKKKPAAKKPAAKKPVAKKPVAKTAPKKAAVKKSAAKKPAAKKAAPKKPTAKKPAPKKPAAKKPTPKKPTAKKTAAKTPAAKRGPGRPRKTEAKTPAKKPTTSKKARS